MIHLQLKRDRSSEKLNSSRSRMIGWVFQALETAQMVCSCPRAVESALSTTKGIAWQHNQVWPPTQKRTGSKATLHFQGSILAQLRFGLGSDKDFLCWTGSSQLDSEEKDSGPQRKGVLLGWMSQGRRLSPPHPLWEGRGRHVYKMFITCNHPGRAIN